MVLNDCLYMLIYAYKHIKLYEEKVRTKSVNIKITWQVQSDCRSYSIWRFYSYPLFKSENMGLMMDVKFAAIGLVLPSMSEQGLIQI